MSNETSKCFEKRRQAGDFETYLNGDGIDIGCGEDVLRVLTGTVLGWDELQGDAQYLSTIDDNTQDFVYSSHCLEHMESVSAALENWFRVLRPRRFLYVVIPDYFLYEKAKWPSRYNSEHQHSFSLDLARDTVKRPNHWHVPTDLKAEIEKHGTLIASYLERDGYEDSRHAEDQTRWNALAQICVVARKEG